MPDSKDYTAGMQAHNSMALSVLNVTSDTVFDKEDREATSNDQQQCSEKYYKSCHNLRYYISKELLQTEENYVTTLSTILKVYKEPLVHHTFENGPILNVKEVRDIFGGIEGILEMHTKIKDSLYEKIAQWCESSCLGSVFDDKVLKDIVTKYPPFVNYFELRIKAINQCKRKYPLFKTFLMEKESKLEFQRQNLEGMLITPIQRIPRIILLLQNLLKCTPEKHLDHVSLNNAVKKMKDTLIKINENKREVHNQMAMFDVVAEIKDCPAFVLSSTRVFLRKVEAFAINLCSLRNRSIKSQPIATFVFNDSIEITQKKMIVTFGRITTVYKHTQFIVFRQVRFLINFTSGSEMFGLVVVYPEESQEKLLVFQLPRHVGTATKDDLLAQLCGLISSANNISDKTQLLITAPVDFLYCIIHPSPGKSSEIKLLDASKHTNKPRKIAIDCEKQND
ncbi:protein ECT2-like [Dysidea avara]|uniref:protein ECT2-like n=1 Tax=Dysidea avara TaxID=196820 RepID=UPI00332C4519